MPAANTTPAELIAAFALGFTTRKTARGDAPLAKAQRAGATARKMTSDLNRATTNWLSLEVYYASSAGACLAEKGAQAVVLLPQ